MYAYGPLKNSYFTTFEKIWIEGFCKERGISLSESNLLLVLMMLSETSTAGIQEKSLSVLVESKKFSEFVSDMFMKSWDNILGYSMKMVKPGKITEEQVLPLSETSKWWLTNAPKILSEELKMVYSVSFAAERLSTDDISVIDTFSAGRKNPISEMAKSIFDYKCVSKPFPPCRLNVKDVLTNETAINLFPQPEKVVAMAAWTAECVSALNEHKRQ